MITKKVVWVSRCCDESLSAAQCLSCLLQCLDPHLDYYTTVEPFKTMQSPPWKNHGHSLCICLQDAEEVCQSFYVSSPDEPQIQEIQSDWLVVWLMQIRPCWAAWMHRQRPLKEVFLSQQSELQHWVLKSCNRWHVPGFGFWGLQHQPLLFFCPPPSHLASSAAHSTEFRSSKVQWGRGGGKSGDDIKKEREKEKKEGEITHLSASAKSTLPKYYMDIGLLFEMSHTMHTTDCRGHTLLLSVVKHSCCINCKGFDL